MQSVARLIQVFVLSAVCLSKPAFAGEIGADLLTLLRLIPEEEATYKAAPIFNYVDMGAIKQAPSLPRSADTPTRSDAQQRWEAARPRVVGSELFSRIGHALNADRMREVVGFSWLEIDRELSFGEPPNVVMVLQGDLPDAERLQSTLAPRGFERREIGGVPVFHRFEDFKLSIGLGEPADPFGGNLGQSARIAILRAGLLASAASWPRLEKVLAVAGGSEPVSEIVPLVEALLPALRELGAGADVSLLQAGAYSLAQLSDGVIDAGKMLDPTQGKDYLERYFERRRTQPDSVLWPYPLAFLFDLQAGMDQINVIALPYPDREIAAASADVLAERLAKWSPDDSGKEPSLVEVTGGTIERRVVAVPSDGRKAIALVSVRYPLPTSQPSAGSGASEQRSVPARNLRSWLGAIWGRKFSPLFLLNYR